MSYNIFFNQFNENNNNKKLAHFRFDGSADIGSRRCNSEEGVVNSRYSWVVGLGVWGLGVGEVRTTAFRSGAEASCIQSAAMELREMNVATDAEETAELLPAFQRDEEIESYFIEYAIQKEIINRNRSSSSRRLLSQAAHLTDHSSSNSNQKVL